jgi:hypothetical protein
MRITVQVVIEQDGQNEPERHEVAQLDRGELDADTVGLQLAEAKQILASVQEVMVAEQIRACLDARGPCPDCGQARRHKDARTITLRTVFGRLRLESPRWHHCPCRPQPRKTFSPLAEILSERTTPELLYLETKFASLMSYGLSARLLGELLPLGRRLHATAIRRHTHKTAERLESELGPERPMFIDGCQRDWEQLPRPEMPLTVGLDGGYVHACEQPSRREGWFEVIAGKSIPAKDERAAKCFAFVQTYDTKPKRRLYELLTAQGMQANQQVTFLTDGGTDVRELPLYLNPQAEHLIDWFHITMRLTVLGQMTKGLGPEPARAAASELERLKWFLWHGNAFRALQVIGDLKVDLDIADSTPQERKLYKALAEFGHYIAANAAWIPNYGERYRHGEAISNAFVESAVNQIVSKRMVKKQQMRWSPRGAHLLLQIRTQVINEDLHSTFRRWYPGLMPTIDQQPLAA